MDPPAAGTFDFQLTHVAASSAAKGLQFSSSFPRLNGDWRCDRCEVCPFSLIKLAENPCLNHGENP